MPEPIRTFGKADAFYNEFNRKGPGEITTHYCPGCGHGTVQKFIAAAIDELGIKDRTIFLSPVGCAVFSYYYFDTGNIQCSHGRSPAVATGVRRTLDDAIVIGYQGDGDLAGIGLTEIIHAANRGENYSVFFLNNAIYGMTGGQMAPTTLLGQKTLTTPFGRDSGHDGNPIGMAELINSLAAPVYIERCSLSTPKQVLKTRQAVRKALRYQVERRGFSFVEILSPCPTNWGMTPIDARQWMEQNLERTFRVGRLRDMDEERTVPIAAANTHLDDDALLALLGGTALQPAAETTSSRPAFSVKVAGFGGQGVLSAGELLAACALTEGYNATWLPSYGPEMRGGSANASVIISDEAIGSPVVDSPNVLLAMNGPALDAFEKSVVPGGTIVVNSSIATHASKRRNVKVVSVPATQLAKDAGIVSGANVAMLTAYLAVSAQLSLDTLRSCIPQVLRKKAYLGQNLALVDITLDYLSRQGYI